LNLHAQLVFPDNYVFLGASIRHFSANTTIRTTITLNGTVVGSNTNVSTIVTDSNNATNPLLLFGGSSNVWANGFSHLAVNFDTNDKLSTLAIWDKELLSSDFANIYYTMVGVTS
jgi:hypothetical protein